MNDKAQLFPKVSMLIQIKRVGKVPILQYYHRNSSRIDPHRLQLLLRLGLKNISKDL